ncbi:MAG: ATPase [Patescibacteria group bacterium]|nr:ATPase [Patescibacteria group bacterium]
MSAPLTITKSDGTRQPFQEEKLAASLRKVGAADSAVAEIVGDVERGMKDGMTTADIYGRAFALLSKHHRGAAVKYSIRRAMMELGPDGFPFERFVARIFKLWGYEALTDQTLMGSCISHEVDVVAWKADKLVLVEAKYHNEFDLKSDAKVALYIQARREDLSGALLDYGGVKRRFDEFWLVTNTKFSEMAIRYGECKGLKMVGWNYPAHGNLHEIIERNGLHPVTALTSLTRAQKRDLVGRGVLVCIDVIGDPAILDQIGVAGDAKERVLAETQMVIEQGK